MKKQLKTWLTHLGWQIQGFFFQPELAAEEELRQKMALQFCTHQRRKQRYLAFLRQGKKTPRALILFGRNLMRRYRLHPHFFGNNTLLDTARHLTFFALGLPYKNANPALMDHSLSEADTIKVLASFEKRIAERIPVEYITQEAEYLGNSFYVNSHVLVPRSLMNTRFQDFLAEMHWTNKRVLDLCTGSGCIGISLALLNPEIQVDLADISDEALQVAAVNIKKHGLETRVTCIRSNLFENICNTYDLIITNPPYVATKHYRRGPLEFKNEPRLALEAGADGLNLVRRILQGAKDYLHPSGKLIMEVGFPAAKKLKHHYPKLPLKWYTYRKPNGKSAFLAMDCVFECQAKDLLLFKDR